MNTTLKFYISQLSPKRATNYSESWFNVGKAIYFNTKENGEGYDIWHEFSKQDSKYNKEMCDKKWEYFKKKNYIYSLRFLVPYIYEDGGTTFNANNNKFIEDENVRNLVYILLSKLSIRRMRNIKALNNLCSALYYMSFGKDKHVLDIVCKRIKDEKLKNIFLSFWERKYFYGQFGLNDIICWLNSDEKEKPYPRATNIKYYTNNPIWVEQTTNYLKSFDNAGYTPRYFKVSAEERKKLKPVIEKRKKSNKITKSLVNLMMM